MSKWGISLHGIFGSWAWYTQGSAKYAELLGRRRRRRRHLENDQIWAKVIFLQNWHIPKFQDMLFSRNKSPCGSVPQKVTFSEVTLREFNHFQRDFKIPLFQKNRDFDDNLPIKIHFHRKPKWSVWSIRTTFKGLDWKLLAQKWSYGRKLKFWRGGKFPNSVLRSRVDFWGFLEIQNWF